MRQRYSSWVLAFLFAVGVIVVYKTVDNFNFVFDYAGKIIGALGPFLAGFVIAYLLNIPKKKLEGLFSRAKNGFVRRHKKGLAIASVYVLALIALTLLVRSIAPMIYKNIMDLYYSAPYYLDLMTATLTEWQDKLGVTVFSFDKQETITRVQDFISNLQFSEFGKYAQGVINATSGVISTFISVIISIYLLSDSALIKQAAARFVRAVMKPESISHLKEYLERINDIFSKYIISVVLDGIIIGIVSAIAMSIMRVKYAPVFGLMLGVFNLIPYFGAIAACILTIGATLLTGGIFKAIWTGVLLIVLQQIDGNFIGPKIMGNMLEARPLLIIFAVTLGGGLFGVWGMILSVPVAMVVKMLLEEFIKTREEKKGIR